MKLILKLKSSITFSGLFIFLTLTLCSSCMHEPFQRETLEDLPAELPSGPAKTNKDEIKDQTIQSRLTLENYFFSFSSVCMIRIQGEKLTAAGLLPSGIKLFELSGTGDKLENCYFREGTPLAGKESWKRGEMLLRALRNIFCHNDFLYRGVPAGMHMKRGEKLLRLHDPEQGIFLEYGHKEVRLLKKSQKNQSDNWQTEYYRCIVTKSGPVPEQIVYKNKKVPYRLVFRIYDWQTGKE